MNYEDRDPYGMYRRHSLDSDSTPHKGPGPALMGANTLIGNDVFNEDHEKLGDIKEIMLHVHSGRVGYAVLSFGGFFGLGDKLFAVPWAALTLDTVNKRFMLKVPKERLSEAPGFAKDNWPDMADSTWSQGIHHWYGLTEAGDSDS